MTDATICDRCGAVSTYIEQVDKYDLPRSVWDTETHEDAINVRGDGDLCEDCSFELARWIVEGDAR